MLNMHNFVTDQQKERYSDVKKYPFKPEVETTTQEYVDEPVYKLKKWKLKLWVTILFLFPSKYIARFPRIDVRKMIAFDRIILNWNRPPIEKQ